MEVRVESKRKRFPMDGNKIWHIFWKILLAVLALCLLSVCFIWNQGKKTEAQASSFVMEKDSKGRYIFNVVEVVPDKNEAVLGFFIKGAEPIPEEKIMDPVIKNWSSGQYQAVEKFFYWENSKKLNTNEPFTVVEENGETKLVNNEIFKLYMMGFGTYNPQLSIYDNYKANKTVLEQVDKEYVINYRAMTPSEFNRLSMDEINKIHYLHIGSGEQLENYYLLLKYTGIHAPASWDEGFSKGEDISWEKALALYDRAVPIDPENPATPRMSLSFSQYSMMRTGDHTLNLYKLFQMIHYFDDPAMFREVFQGGSLAKENAYVDSETGKFYVPWSQNGMPEWDDSWMNQLDLSGVTHTWMEAIWEKDTVGRIPDKYDNILTYSHVKNYFNAIVSNEYVNKILHFQDHTPTPPEEEADGKVKVLEIEPTNSYYLAQKENLEKLAKAVDVDKDEISVTYATPNRLNGMAVDLAAEFDLILIGDDIARFSQTGSYTEQDPYRHIGSYEDGVTLQTALNGLLKEDYTTVGDFNTAVQKKAPGAALNPGFYALEPSGSHFWNDGLRDQWAKAPNVYFLQNMELSLELKSLGASVDISRARFSGNDLSRYMQGQLADFIESGQPVVVAQNVYNRADELVEGKTKDGRELSDARLYLALCGSREDYKEGKNIKNDLLSYLYIKENYLGVENKKISLKREFKPIVTVFDKNSAADENDEANEINETNESDGAAKTIVEKGRPGEEKPTLTSLAKSNYLSFRYRIELPAFVEAKDCEMTVILDQNGDGMFDREGQGKTFVNGKKGSQNNATASIKNDKGFVYDFSKAKETEYTVIKGAGEDGRDVLTGIFTAREPVDSMEEICQFRVEASAQGKKNNKNNGNGNGSKKDEPLRGVWTGYMRPNLKKKNVKVLQITPYPGGEGGKPLSENAQFKKWVAEAELLGGEYHFDLGNSEMYAVVQEDDFAAECAGVSVKTKLKELQQYDLIIAGTDFTCEAAGDEVDFGELNAAEVLQKYADELKRPIIFTNDAMSYVNSYNYVTPAEKEYYYRNMTVEEGEFHTEKGALDEKSGEYRRLEIPERDYKVLQGLNAAAREEKWKKSGTVWLDSEPLHEKTTKAGTYQAVVCPLTDEMAGEQETGKMIVGFQTAGDSAADAAYGVLTLNDTDGNARQLSLEEISGTGKPAGDILKPEEICSNITGYSARLGYITEAQLRGMYEKQAVPSADAGTAADGEDLAAGAAAEKAAGAAERIITVNDAAGQPYSFRYSDIHRLLWRNEAIPEQLVNTKKPVFLPGIATPFYPFTVGDGKQYLAVRTDEAQGNLTENSGYLWQLREKYESAAGPGKKEYVLTDVAGTAGALYPSRNVWNYFFTQSMRYVMGMDRFAVTTDQQAKKKRDNGSSHEGREVKEIQGFTNGALLEYAYLPPDDAAWRDDAGLNTRSPYRDEEDAGGAGSASLKLGTAPRTDAIEAVNEGPVCLYPFKIADENYSETRIEVLENHSPYYQLDLDRELGEGKIDDVTVWYTFAGTKDGSQEKKDKSRYFDVTVKDAGNNYYLYSKGKSYYTGFSLYDEDGASAGGEYKELVPDMEMKLFVNLIYAALSSEPGDFAGGYYEALVKEGGAAACVLRSGQPGSNNQYVCYYEEDEEALKLEFLVQRQGALSGEIVPLLLGFKDGTDSQGKTVIKPFEAGIYRLPENIDQSLFPVQPVSEAGQGGADPDNPPEEGKWYWLTLPFDETGYDQKFWDGKTIVIGSDAAGGSAGGITGTIDAEVRLVQRSLFDLD